MTGTQIIEKKLFSGLQNLVDESADSRLNWNGIIPKFKLTFSKLSCVCACYTLKEDNFVVLQVVYETENSKVVVIFKEPRLGYSRTSMERLVSHFWDTTGRHSRPSFLTVFLLRAPLSTDVLVLLLNHSIVVVQDTRL